MLRAGSATPRTVILALAGLLHACGGDSTRPSPPFGPTPALATIVRIEIAGPRTVGPGEIIQLGLVGNMSDGSTVDLSCQAVWRSQQGDTVSFDPNGRSTGRQARETVV